MLTATQGCGRRFCTTFPAGTQNPKYSLGFRRTCGRWIAHCGGTLGPFASSSKGFIAPVMLWVQLNGASVSGWPLNAGPVLLFNNIYCLLPACCFCVFLNMPTWMSCKWKLMTREVCPWHGRPTCLHSCEENSTASAQGSLSSSCLPIALRFGSPAVQITTKMGYGIKFLAVVLYCDTQKLLASEMPFVFPASVLLKLLNGCCLRTTLPVVFEYS